MTNSFSKTLQASSPKITNQLGLFPISSQHWILDSGATDHIVSSSKKLTCNKNGSMISVLLPNGEKTQISSTGSIPLNSHYILHDVLCIPNFKVDLMSISRLTWGLNCSVTFYPYWCILQDLVSRKVIGLGKQRKGLYYLMALATDKSESKPNHSSPIQSACHLTVSSASLWHRRLGHVASRPLEYIAKHSLNTSLNSDNQVCDVCPLAKQHRLLFGSSSISSVSPFDLIHAEIWGPYKHHTLSGAHYFLTIVDDYSRFSWVFLMRHKDETQSLVKQFFVFASTQFSSKIKSFRSDNGAEFLSLQTYFKDNGVFFSAFLCLYAPTKWGSRAQASSHPSNCSCFQNSS